MSVFHLLQVKSIQRWYTFGDRSWCRLVLLWCVSMSEIVEVGIGLLGNLVEASEINTESKRAVFLPNKRTSAPWGECDGQINPAAMFSSMNLHRVASSSWDQEYIRL